MLDGHQQAIGFHQFVEDFLSDVLGVAGIGNAAADEVAQPRLLALDYLGDSLVLFQCHPLQARHRRHPLL